MKKAFGLPQAIMIILFISTVLVVSLKIINSNVKRYSDAYIKEQADLMIINLQEWSLYQMSKVNPLYNSQTNGYMAREQFWCGTKDFIDTNEIFYSSTDVKKSLINFKAKIEVDTYFMMKTHTDGINWAYNKNNKKCKYYGDPEQTWSSTKITEINSPQSNGMIVLKITLKDENNKVYLVNRSLQRP